MDLFIIKLTFDLLVGFPFFVSLRVLSVVGLSRISRFQISSYPNFSRNSPDFWVFARQCLLYWKIMYKIFNWRVHYFHWFTWIKYCNTNIVTIFNITEIAVSKASNEAILENICSWGLFLWYFFLLENLMCANFWIGSLGKFGPFLWFFPWKIVFLQNFEKSLLEI